MLLHLVEQLQLKLSAPTPPSTLHRLPPAGSVCRRRRHLMEQSKLKLSAPTPPSTQHRLPPAGSVCWQRQHCSGAFGAQAVHIDVAVDTASTAAGCVGVSAEVGLL